MFCCAKARNCVSYLIKKLSMLAIQKIPFLRSFDGLIIKEDNFFLKYSISLFGNFGAFSSFFSFSIHRMFNESLAIKFKFLLANFSNVEFLISKINEFQIKIKFLKDSMKFPYKKFSYRPAQTFHNKEKLHRWKTQWLVIDFEQTLCS